MSDVAEVETKEINAESKQESEAKTLIAKNDIDSKEKLLELISPKVKKIQHNTIVNAKVLSFDRDEALVDIGYKTEGVIPVGEYLPKGTKHFEEDSIKTGVDVEVLVLKLNDKNGRVLLSKRRAEERHIWEKIEDANKSDKAIKGRIVKAVNYGVTVDLGGVLAFMPISQIDERGVNLDDLESHVGRDVEVNVLDIKNSNIIVSRKEAQKAKNKVERAKIIKELEVGQVRKGKVAALADFGAFIDLGGIDGLVHLSEISWNTIDKASEVLEIDQEVMVQITELNVEKGRVSLSIRATQPDPWVGFADEFAIGQVVKGIVRKVTEYGEVISINKFIEAHIDRNEIVEERITNIGDILPVGVEVFVKITDVDLIRHRVHLSIRRATEGVNLTSDDFDPEVYGMKAEHNDDGSYKYPDGFDAKTGKWKKGFEKEKETWEAEYAKAQKLFEEHKKFINKLHEDLDKKAVNKK